MITFTDKNGNPLREDANKRANELCSKDLVPDKDNKIDLSCGFEWDESKEGYDCWENIYKNQDYTIFDQFHYAIPEKYHKPTFETPAGTFERGEGVEVWIGNYAPIVSKFYAYDSELEYPYIVYASGKVEVLSVKNCRKIEKKVYTIDQLKELAAEREGVSVEQIEIV